MNYGVSFLARKMELYNGTMVVWNPSQLELDQALNSEDSRVVQEVVINFEGPLSLEGLSSLPSLTSLSMVSPLVVGDMGPLTSLTSLMSLRIDGSYGYSTLAKVLSSLTSLVHLELRTLTNLPFRGGNLPPTVGDELGTLTNLRTLKLGDFHVPDFQLGKLQGLEVLELRYSFQHQCEVSIPATLTSLRELRMDCVHLVGTSTFESLHLEVVGLWRCSVAEWE